jgi:hypothetical protein
MDVVISSLVSQPVLMRFPVRTCFFYQKEPGFVPNTSFIWWAVVMGVEIFFALPSLDFSICFAVKQRAGELLLYTWKKARCPD